MSKPAWLPSAMAGMVILAAALALSSVSYLLFHTCAELFSIVIAETVFLIAWATRDLAPNASYGLLGVSLGSVGAIDLVHTLAYDGMGLLDVSGSNRAAQLWTVGRYVLALSLLAAALLAGKGKRLPFGAVTALYMAVATGLVASIFGGLFPDCYIEGKGLTTFKKVSEYVVVAILVATFLVLVSRRRHFHLPDLVSLLLGVASLAVGEVLFAFYISAFDFSNYLGHVFKLAGYFFLGRALVASSLDEPLRSLFREADERIARLTELNRRVSSMQDHLVRSEKLAFLGKIAAMMAHEVNSPLAAIASLSRENAAAIAGYLEGAAGLLREAEEDEVEWFKARALPRVEAEPGEDLEGRALARASKRAESSRIRPVLAEALEAASSSSDPRVLAETLAELDVEPSEVAARPGFYARPRVAALAAAALEARRLAWNEALVQGAVRKAERSLLSLMGYTKAATPESLRDCDLATLVEAVLGRYTEAMEGGVEALRDYRPAGTVEGDPERLSLVIENLVLNALQAMSWRGKLGISLGEEGDEVFLSVSDSGPGIPEGLQDQVFKPFFTTKPEAEGLGLGLDLSRRIVTEAGGRIDFRSHRGRTVFTIRFPKKNARRVP